MVPGDNDDSFHLHLLEAEVLDEVFDLVIAKVLLGFFNENVGPLLVEFREEEKEPVVFADLIAFEGT